MLKLQFCWPVLRERQKLRMQGGMGGVILDLISAISASSSARTASAATSPSLPILAAKASLSNDTLFTSSLKTSTTPGSSAVETANSSRFAAAWVGEEEVWAGGWWPATISLLPASKTAAASPPAPLLALLTSFSRLIILPSTSPRAVETLLAAKSSRSPQVPSLGISRMIRGNTFHKMTHQCWNPTKACGQF